MAGIIECHYCISATSRLMLIYLMDKKCAINQSAASSLLILLKLLKWVLVPLARPWARP